MRSPQDGTPVTSHYGKLPKTAPTHDRERMYVRMVVNRLLILHRRSCIVTYTSTFNNSKINENAWLIRALFSRFPQACLIPRHILLAFLAVVTGSYSALVSVFLPRIGPWSSESRRCHAPTLGPGHCPVPTRSAACGHGGGEAATGWSSSVVIGNQSIPGAHCSFHPRAHRNGTPPHTATQPRTHAQGRRGAVRGRSARCVGRMTRRIDLSHLNRTCAALVWTLHACGHRIVAISVSFDGRRVPRAALHLDTPSRAAG